MLARRKERLDDLQTALGVRAIGIACDVTDLDSLAAAVDEAIRSLGGLDAVIAVAARGMVGTICTGTLQRRREQLEDIRINELVVRPTGQLSP